MQIDAALPAVPSLFFSPIQWTCDKLKKLAAFFFGAIMRTAVFQLGEKHFGARIIMRLWQCLTGEKAFDPPRLAASKTLLKEIGGIEVVLSPADGGAQVHCMTFTSQAFFAKLARDGAAPLTVTYKGEERKVLLNPPSYLAEKFYIPSISVKLHDGRVVQAALLPKAPQFQGSAPIIMHSHSPGRSMCMDRKSIGQHLAAGYDLAIWDPRGTADSTGEPSEGGYYLDAEAVFEHIHRTYPAPRIYLSGYCEGVSCAAHLKRKYHELGVHFIASNPYTSMKEVIEGYGWIGKIAARYGLGAIQSSDPQITSRVRQDGFDNVAKFRNLPSGGGMNLFIHTDTDKIMPKGSVQRICDVITDSSTIREIGRIHPDPTANGHMQPPLEDPRVWHRYVGLVR